MKLGTYSTFDCPTKKIDEAYEWLQIKFAKIDGLVKKVMNPHDFGSYPSFEIDYSAWINSLSEKGDCGDELSDEEQEELDKWHDEADRIQTEYSKKFGEWL